ncbi:unnamed protein product [Nezara viridula]|uniref:Uncharacterized protein n=1 Tax=Nezara viridula TaxID=85310 RepID=A0A9P0HDR6_NEZVI|nr:unnamed protein product [Nezara viridula]
MGVGNNWTKRKVRPAKDVLGARPIAQQPMGPHDLKVELGRAVTLKQWKSGCETTPTLHRENGNKPRQIHIPEHAALIDPWERCRPHATSSCYLFIR